MNKIIVIGDTHIGLGYPNKESFWYKIHVEYFSEFLLPLLKKEVSEGDIIIHVGDFFDNRNIVPINLLNYGMHIIEEISKLSPLHILIGNHDAYHNSTSEITSLKPFKYIPNVTIYDTPTKIEFCGKSILMLPWVEKKRDQIDILKKYSGCDYLFCHSDLNGARMHLSPVVQKNPDKIDVDEFSGYKHVYSGHIHLVQDSKNFKFVGNNFQMDRNDTDNEKGIYIIDLDNDTDAFIKNTISPVFKKLIIKTESDVDMMDSYKDTKDYIDLVISNSLLVSNRKLRRKLEILLETGKFASIEYLDDITKPEDKKSESEMTDEEVNISLHLDYEDYIKNYINSQKYENDNFKEGVLKEFDEIIGIFNENYKLVNGGNQ